MDKKISIYYWSPFISSIATIRAVINSAYSLVKFGNQYETSIINFFCEYNDFEKEINKKNINLIYYFKSNISKFLPSYGKIKSRFSFLIIFILGFFPLKRLISERKPEYLIIQLISSLPLILLIFFNFKTKFILRISGFPRLGFFRKFIWRIAFKKIYAVTCPTKNTFNYIKNLNIIDKSKLKILYDPIISVKEINLKKKEKSCNSKDFFLSVGRLTKQKNFIFLCRAFKEVLKEFKDLKLLIAGDGEEKLVLQNYININKLENNIKLIGHKKNIFPYFSNAKGFILSSLWEDPGFVLVEAGFCRVPVFSSNAWPGPMELIRDNYNGINFENNNITSFKERFKIFIEEKNKKKLMVLLLK